MFTGLFWKDTFERVLVTMAQVLIALWTVDGFDLLNVNWKATAAAVVTAGVLSLLKAVVAAKVTDPSVSPASLATNHDFGVR